MSLNISAIGFGCMKASFNNPDPETRQSTIEAIHTAIDNGVTILDTSDIYAPSWDTFGHNERLVAEALATYGKPHSAFAATKGGITRGPGETWGRNSTLDYLLRAVEASALRLGVEKIHLWQHHRLDPKLTLRTQLENLAKLKERGLIEHIGVSNYSAEQLRLALKIVGPIATVQNQFNLIYRHDSDVFEVCEENGIKFLPWSPMRGAHPGQASTQLVEFAREHQASTYAVAVAWLKSLSSSMVPLPGVTRSDSVLDAIGGLSLTLKGEVPLGEELPIDKELLSDQPLND